MDGTVLVALITVAGTIVAALLGWWGIRHRDRTDERHSSGTVETSEAETLWAEANAMRKELREEVVHLRAELKRQDEDCSRRLAVMEGQLNKMQGKLREAGGA